jgi:7,8-dihydro-6-hydroxymethylpterin-pyrophosphokinase
LYISLAANTSERLEAVEEAIDILKKDMENTFVGTGIFKSKVLKLKPFDGVRSSKELENFYMGHGTVL